MCTYTFITLQIQTYKEDFEQERKDRENAHRIKEEEIQKVRVEQEGLKADHHENLQLIQDNYKGQITAYTQKVSFYASTYIQLLLSRLTIVSCEAKRKQATYDE